MKRYRTAQKYIAFVCSFAFIFILTSGQAEAARRSRVLSIGLFASGMGLQFGSSLLKASAQDRYDTYLNAAIQADIQTHKDAFRVRRDASTIMSRVGLGCVGLAVLFSIYNHLDTTESLDGGARSDNMQGRVSSADNSKIQVKIPQSGLRGFTNRLSQNTSLLFPRTTFQLHPHYDFQTQQASLRVLHHF
jgi:hypothetical protein